MGALGSKPLSEADARKAFDEMDVNGDHNINATELKPIIMKLLNRAPSRSELTALINSVDDSADGTLQFDEFLKLVRTFEAWGRDDERLLAEVRGCACGQQRWGGCGRSVCPCRCFGAVWDHVDPSPADLSPCLFLLVIALDIALKTVPGQDRGGSVRTSPPGATPARVPAPAADEPVHRAPRTPRLPDRP